MYHKPRMCRTCLQMSRGDFKFVNLDSVDPLWESNSPNLKEQLIYIVPEMKLEGTESYICTSCFIALRTAYEFKRMCQVTEQKFQNYNYKYRRPFGVGPGSPQFHVTLNENNNSSSVPTYRCQNLNYLQTDTSIDITEHHLYDASKVLPRKQLAYLNNVSQKLPEIDVEVIMSDKSDKTSNEDAKDNKNEKQSESKNESKADNKTDKSDSKTDKLESKPGDRKTEANPEKKIDSKCDVKSEAQVPITNENKQENKSEDKESNAQKDTKPKPIFPNLPGIEIVPKSKIDSTELRKKYNIGSQISILKTPKQSSATDFVIKKACEEIPYLKTNNIAPEALNCAIKLEFLTSQLTTRVTAEKYTSKELEEVAKSYYEGCPDTLLNCKLCDRSFSTEFWLNAHEDDHASGKLAVEVKKDNVAAEGDTRLAELSSHKNEFLMNPENTKDASNKIAIPLQLQNDQISITPIQKTFAVPNSKPTKFADPLLEPKQESEISLSTFKKSALPTMISSSEISLIRSENQYNVKKERDSDQFEKVVNRNENLLKPFAASYQLSSNSEKSKISIKQELPESTTPTVRKPKSRYKLRRFKSLFKKNRPIKLKYFKCFVCFKHFKTKFSLQQHCNFIHIPNETNSNYWSNFISLMKEQKLKQEFDHIDMEVRKEDEKEERKIIIQDSIRITKPKRAVAIQHMCNICDKQLKEAAYVEMHMYVHTPTFVCMDPEVRTDDTLEIFRCYLCDKTFPKERYLKLHNLQVHLNKPCICKICNREFKSEFWFSRHKCVLPSENPEPEEEVEEEGKEVSCTLCDRKFARLRFMKSHRKRMHKDILEKPRNDDSNDFLKKPLHYRNDSDDSEHSDYESNHEYDLPYDDSKEHEVFTPKFFETSVNNVNEARRRSLSRGIPKIQCDFCGEYIEETAYDKHIFEHNKVRLNKSLSKRKSLEYSLEEVVRNEPLLKCNLCFKSFKRRHNFAVHMAKHEGQEGFDLLAADTGDNISEADDTLEDESEVYLSETEAQQLGTIESPQILIINMVKVEDGTEMYKCCDHLFKFKAHFNRHVKKKHTHCTLQFVRDEDAFENSLERNFSETNQSEITEQLDETNRTVDDTITDNDTLDESKLDISTTEQNTSFESVTDSSLPNSTDMKSETDQGENEPKKKRKYTRKLYPINIQSKKGNLRKVPKQNPSERDESLNKGAPLTSNSLNKRKLSADDDNDQVRKLIKTPKLAKHEDMDATALHLRQLDLLPVSNKTSAGYECHVCEKKFRQKCQLRDHFNVHTGERPYKCDFCKPARGFTQTSSLYVHFRRVHAIVTKNCSWEVYSKNGDCLVCSEVFFKHSQMFDHMKTYYTDTEFNCHVCNNNFSMTCHFKTHDIDPEEMQHLLIKEDICNEDEEEPILPEVELEVEGDDKAQSDTDTTERMSGGEDSSNKVIRCSKCDKTFPDKQQLRIHKKSLAHLQQIQAKRRKIKSPKDELDEEEEEEIGDSSVNVDTTDTIEDIENGVKAIIKKIRTFKKHRCNICGMSFVRRMQLKKHKRAHKPRKSKNVSVENLEETTTLELQDVSELNQFIHDDNITDDDDDEDRSTEMEVETNSDEIVDSADADGQLTTSGIIESTDLLKDIQNCSTEDRSEENSGESTSGDAVSKDVIAEQNEIETKVPELNLNVNDESSSVNIATNENVSLSNADELPLESIINQTPTSDALVLSDELGIENFSLIEDGNIMSFVEDTANVSELPICVDENLGQSELPIENNIDVILETAELSDNFMDTTSGTDCVSKESDIQSINEPSVLETGDVTFNDLDLDHSILCGENEGLALDN